MLSPVIPLTLKNTLSLFQTSQDKTELQMVSAASVSSLGPAEESPCGLFLPRAPAQLCSSLWQMAEPDLSQVTALCQRLEFCPEALGPQHSALGPVLLLHTHLLSCSRATSTDSSPQCSDSQPVHTVMVQIVYPGLYIVQQKGIITKRSGLLPNFLSELWHSEFAFCLPPM